MRLVNIVQIALACTLLAGLLVGCSSPRAGAMASPITVTFMVFGDPHEQDAFQAVIDGFHATNPEATGRPIRVEMVGLPAKSDYLTRLAVDFAANTPPDVFLLNYRRLAQYHNRGVLEPLGPRLTHSEALHEKHFFPVALDAFRDGAGTPVCLPQNISSQVVYYNQAHFDQADLAYPAAGWTWAEFRQTAIALTEPDSDGDGKPDRYGLGLEPHLVRVAPFVWQNGGALVDDEIAPDRLVLDSTEAQEAIQFVLDLAQKDNVVPNRTAEAVQSHRERFYTGNIAMYVDSRRIVPTLRAAAQFEWDVAPLPRGRQTANVLHSDGYCLAAASEVKEAAWAFIEYALGAQGQVHASRAGRTVPSLIEVAKSDAFLDPVQPPANAQVWLEAAPYLQLLPRLENWARIERTAAVEFEQAYLGRTSLAEVTDHIQAEAEEGFTRLK